SPTSRSDGAGHPRPQLCRHRRSKRRHRADRSSPRLARVALHVRHPQTELPMTSDHAITAFRAELVAAAKRQADARTRRRRRLTLLAGTVILSTVMAAAAVAASTFLPGQPAPPAVVSDF